MRIYIMRHGQAEVFSGDDSKRELTEVGEQEISQMAQWLKEQLQPLQCVLVSPYKRAQQTWLTAQAYVPCRNQLECDELVPNGNVQQICDYIYALVSEKHLDNLLLISHLPLVSFLVEQLAPKAGAPIFFTGAVACIDFDPDTLLGSLLWMQAPCDL